MSADNYYIIRRHPAGGFVALHGFMSDEGEPVPGTTDDPVFSNPMDAFGSVVNEYTEYGVHIHQECLDVTMKEMLNG